MDCSDDQVASDICSNWKEIKIRLHLLMNLYFRKGPGLKSHQTICYVTRYTPIHPFRAFEGYKSSNNDVFYDIRIA